MRATVKFDGVSQDTLRTILAAVSIAQQTNSPKHCTVNLEGPELFGVTLPALPSAAVADIFGELYALPEWERDLLGL